MQMVTSPPKKVCISFYFLLVFDQRGAFGGGVVSNIDLSLHVQAK